MADAWRNQSHPLPDTEHDRVETANLILKFCGVTAQHWSGIASIDAADLLILVDLYAQEIKGKTISVTSACLASLAPTTTALRAIDRLLPKGLIERFDDPLDRRRKLLRLTELGRERVRAYLDGFDREQWA